MGFRRKKKKRNCEIQLSFLDLLDLWENIARRREESVKKAISEMKLRLESTDWLIIRVGEGKRCAVCENTVKECRCAGGAVVRYDHEKLRVGEIRKNIGNALTDLANLGGFPDGTIIAAKFRKNPLKGEIGFKRIDNSKIYQVSVSEINDLVNWDSVTSTLQDRNKYKDRLSLFTKGSYFNET